MQMLLNHQNFMRLPGLAFLLGIMLASYLPAIPDNIYILATVLVMLAILALVRTGWLRLPAVIMAGAVWLMLHLLWFAPEKLPEAVDSQTIEVSGEIVSLPQVNEQRSRFDFRIDKIHGVPTQWSGKVRLGWYGRDLRLQAGQRWRLKVKLKPAHGYVNPGGFDYEAWLFAKGVSATGYVREPAAATQIGSLPGLHTWRQILSERVAQALPYSSHKGLLIALITGDRQYIDNEQWQVLTRTGTVHLMAISGLHIGLVYGLFFWLGRQLWRSIPALCLRRPAQDIAVVVGLMAAVAYAALAGFSIPTQRALIMLMVIALAMLSRRLIAPMDVLQAALIVVLLVDPLAVVSAGFWLSFAAVTIIFLALSNGEKESGRPRWYQLIRLQWLLALGLLPLTSLFFFQVSIVAPVMNLVAVPWVSLLVVPVSLVGAALVMWSSVLGDAVLMLADGLMQLLWLVLLPASDSPYAVIHPSSPSIWVVMLAAAGLLFLLISRQVLVRIVGLVLIVPMFLPASSPVREGEFLADFLDVGQGLAVVIRTHSHSLLYDAGYSNDSGFDIGRRVILPYLWHEGISHLDHVVLSHDDRDHVGGYRSVSLEVPVDNLSVMPGSRFLSFSHARECYQDQRWQWDGVEFRFLHPSQGQAGKENNRSCVLKVTGRAGNVLLTGDIEREMSRTGW